MSGRYYSDERGNEVAPANRLKLLCGSMASFDHESGISYRCETCFAVVHSIGMPKRCKELYDMEEVVNKLKGKS